MKVLITGSEGFIGTNLTEHLKRQGYEPKAMDLPTGNICDRHFLECESGHVDAIVHLAALTSVPESVVCPTRYFETNVEGTHCVLQAARRNKVGRVVFASSAAAADPRSPYGASKAAGEAMMKAWHHSYGIETVSLRFANVYGPHSLGKSSVVAAFCRAAIEGRPLTVYGDGQQSRDFVHVEDVCRAILLALKAPNVGGQTFSVGTGHGTTVNHLLRMLEEIHDDQDGGNPILTTQQPDRPGEIRESVTDTEPARTALEFEAETCIEVGLMRTYDWFYKKNATKEGAWA